jgi:protein-S-isoprenylcysteine O-methyltransferase Ste14
VLHVSLLGLKVSAEQSATRATMVDGYYVFLTHGRACVLVRNPQYVGAMLGA